MDCVPDSSRPPRLDLCQAVLDTLPISDRNREYDLPREFVRSGCESSSVPPTSFGYESLWTIYRCDQYSGGLSLDSSLGVIRQWKHSEPLSSRYQAGISEVTYR